jgi:hypothetical protein
MTEIVRRHRSPVWVLRDRWRLTRRATRARDQQHSRDRGVSPAVAAYYAELGALPPGAEPWRADPPSRS